MCTANPWSRSSNPIVQARAQRPQKRFATGQSLTGAVKNWAERAAIPCVSPSPPQVIGDAMEVVQSLPDRQFDRIIHDPPTFALGGALYSTAFYSALSRILAARGVLYHYTGDPSSHGTARVVKGVVKRLHEVRRRDGGRLRGDDATPRWGPGDWRGLGHF